MKNGIIGNLPPADASGWKLPKMRLFRHFGGPGFLEIVIGDFSRNRRSFVATHLPIADVGAKEGQHARKNEGGELFALGKVIIVFSAPFRKLIPSRRNADFPTVTSAT